MNTIIKKFAFAMGVIWALLGPEPRPLRHARWGARW